MGAEGPCVLLCARLCWRKGSSVSDEFSKCNLACRRIWLDNQSKSPPRGPVEEIFLTSWECSSSVLVIVMFNSEFLSSLFCLCIIRSLYLQSSHIKPCVKSCVALGLGISMHIDQEITSKCIRTIFNLPRHSNDLLFAPDRIHWNCSYYRNAAVSLVDGQFVRSGRIMCRLCTLGGREENLAEWLWFLKEAVSQSAFMKHSS